MFGCAFSLRNARIKCIDFKISIFNDYQNIVSKLVCFKILDGLYVEVLGKGIPFVFVHGSPVSNGYYYQAFQQGGPSEELGKLIYYDRRDCGRFT
jgi:hypothetical protein